MHENKILQCSAFFVFLTVYIEEIKEVRKGCSSKDFLKQSDYLRKVDSNLCAVIVYGTTFKLKTLSVLGKEYIYCVS